MLCYQIVFVRVEREDVRTRLLQQGKSEIQVRPGRTADRATLQDLLRTRTDENESDVAGFRGAMVYGTTGSKSAFSGRTSGQALAIRAAVKIPQARFTSRAPRNAPFGRRVTNAAVTEHGTSGQFAQRTPADHAIGQASPRVSPPDRQGRLLEFCNERLCLVEQRATCMVPP